MIFRSTAFVLVWVLMGILVGLGIKALPWIAALFYLNPWLVPYSLALVVLLLLTTNWVRS